MLSFVVQLAAVAVALDVSSVWLGTFVKAAMLPWSWLDLTEKVVETVLPDVLGLLAGLLLSRFPAFLREPGRWIWVVPAAIFPVLLVVSFFVDFHDPLLAIYGVRGAEYERFGFIGLIFPACSICLYSIGIRTGDRHSNPLANVFGDEDIIPDDGEVGTSTPAQRKPGERVEEKEPEDPRIDIVQDVEKKRTRRTFDSFLD